MTIIEFYDKDACENICSSLIRTPERVVLVGQKSTKMENDAARYHRLLKDRGVDVPFECREVNKNKRSQIERTLTEIVNTYEDCVFDLTGGDELFLTAVGIVYERFKEEKKIQMHRVILRNGTIIDCDGDGVMLGTDRKPSLSVSEHMMLYGGKVVKDTDRPDGTCRRVVTDALLNDVREMWEICRENVQYWNARTGAMEVAFELFGRKDSLTMDVNMVLLEQEIKGSGEKFWDIRSFVRQLSSKRLVTYSSKGDDLSVTFKSEDVRDCLIKAGQLLELVVYCFAKRVTAKDGSLLFDDVMTGVTIDWDGEIHQKRGMDTINEVDVVMMHGMIPVFVSCKNGGFDANELYKLNTVAERFGGAYARKVLVTTALSKSEKSKNNRLRKADMNIRLRAEDMNIRLIENLTDYTLGQDKPAAPKGKQGKQEKLPDINELFRKMLGE